MRALFAFGFGYPTRIPLKESDRGLLRELTPPVLADSPASLCTYRLQRGHSGLDPIREAIDQRDLRHTSRHSGVFGAVERQGN
jgi:hypothetical protein